MMNETHRARALARSKERIVHLVVLHQADTANRQLTGVNSARILNIVLVFLLSDLCSVILE